MISYGLDGLLKLERLRTAGIWAKWIRGNPEDFIGSLKFEGIKNDGRSP